MSCYCKNKFYNDGPELSICLTFPVVWSKCDQIGLFWKLLSGKFSHKSSQNVWWLFGLFKRNVPILVKTVLTTFGATYGKNRANFCSNFRSHCLERSTHFESKKMNLPSFDLRRKIEIDEDGQIIFFRFLKRWRYRKGHFLPQIKLLKTLMILFYICIKLKSSILLLKLEFKYFC